MSDAADTGGGSISATASHEVTFDPDEWARIWRAVDESRFDGPEEVIARGALRLVEDLLEGGGDLECPHDDCERTFATVRERRGHLGSSEHALDVPEGDFWCGYCGYGATSWRGVNAHHGQSDHDGDPVRLQEEPDRDDLLAPDDVPDHKRPELLERLYQEHDGNYTEMCRSHDFEVGAGRVRHYLIEFGIHEPTPHGASDGEDGPVYRDPEWLQEQYDAAGGNISEMHRQIDVDVPYRTLQKNLKNLGVHDPTDPPGKRHGKGGPKPSADDEDQDDIDEEDDVNHREEDEDKTDLSETDAGDVQDDVDEEDHVKDDDLILVDHPDDVEDFSDLATPDWLDEGSFYAALDISDDVEELVENLGWRDHDRVGRAVQLLDLVEELDGADPEVLGR